MSKFEKISILKTGEIVKKKKSTFCLSVFSAFSLRSQGHPIVLEEYVCFYNMLT